MFSLKEVVPSNKVGHFREWNVKEWVNTLLKCKEHLTIQQVCFVVQRTWLNSFVGEVRANRILPSAKSIQSRRVSGVDCILEQELEHGVGSKRMAQVERSIREVQKAKTQRLYAEIKNFLSAGQVGSSKTVQARMFGEGCYNLLWNTTHKQYESVVIADADRQDDPPSNSFLKRLNSRIQKITHYKEGSSLMEALSENGYHVGYLILATVLGMLICLFIEGILALLVSLFLCFGSMAAILFRIVNQNIFSQDILRN